MGFLFDLSLKIKSEKLEGVHSQETYLLPTIYGISLVKGLYCVAIYRIKAANSI